MHLQSALMCMCGALPQAPKWQIVQDPRFNALLDYTLRRLFRMTPRQLANGVRALVLLTLHK